MKQQEIFKLIIKIYEEHDLGLENNKWGTDKMHPKSYYEKFYSKIISQLGQVGTILEIGVRGGASMFLWQKLFPEALVIGCDLEGVDTELGPKSEYVTLKNSTFIQGNAYLEEFSSSVNSNLDLAIDDGSHFLKDQLKFVELYLPKLSDKGVLVIEDVQKAYPHVFQVFSKVDLNKFKVQAYDFRFNKGHYDDFVITAIKGKTSKFYILYCIFRSIIFPLEKLALKFTTRK